MVLNYSLRLKLFFFIKKIVFYRSIQNQTGYWGNENQDHHWRCFMEAVKTKPAPLPPNWRTLWRWPKSNPPLNIIYQGGHIKRPMEEAKTKTSTKSVYWGGQNQNPPLNVWYLAARKTHPQLYASIIQVIIVGEKICDYPNTLCLHHLLRRFLRPSFTATIRYGGNNFIYRRNRHHRCLFL